MKVINHERQMGVNVEPAAAAKVFTQQRIRQVRDAVEAWSQQLINVDGRNRLLFHRDLKLGTLDLSDAEPAAVDGLLNGRAMRLSQLFDDGTLPDRLRRARTIRNKTREFLEERGIATCFLAVGMATWTNPKDATRPAAPVLLHKASITARRRRRGLRPGADWRGNCQPGLATHAESGSSPRSQAALRAGRPKALTR
jgi:hypothetical protein